MPQSLAEARIKLTLLTTKPANPNAVTLAEATAGKDIECRIAKDGFKLGATASDTIDDAALCAAGNAKTPGSSNFEGQVTPYRYFDSTGKAESTASGTPGELGDYAYQTLKTKGTRAWLLKRLTSKAHDEAWASGDEYSLFEIVTDNPQDPSAMTGYIKYAIPLLVQDAWLDKTIAGA